MKKGNYTTTSETFQALEKRKEAVQNRREVITLGRLRPSGESTSVPCYADRTICRLRQLKICCWVEISGLTARPMGADKFIKLFEVGIEDSSESSLDGKRTIHSTC